MFARACVRRGVGATGKPPHPPRIAGRVLPRFARLLPPIGGSRKTVSASAPPRHLRQGGEQFVLHSAVASKSVCGLFTSFAAMRLRRWSSAPNLAGALPPSPQALFEEKGLTPKPSCFFTPHNFHFITPYKKRQEASYFLPLISYL